MTTIAETTASSTGTNTPNIGPDVFVASGFGHAGPSTATDGVTTATETGVREAALKARALKRAEKREKNHALAVDLSKAGDALLELQDYAGACANYLHATRLWPSNDKTYLKLTEAYLKCNLYSEATRAATRGLSFNPKSLEQRYLRGVARLEQSLLDAAKADFTTVLAHDPNHSSSKSKLELIDGQLENSSDAAQNKFTFADAIAGVAPPTVTVAQAESTSTTRTGSAPSDLLVSSLSDIDFGFPKYDDDRLEIASLSDSSEANHYGNGIPCRFYNHTGCVKGQQCEFSHAPDEQSVRDELGRNVCIYFLLDACKFGIPKCVYSHSRESLPSDGRSWWNDEKQRSKVKSVLEMAEAKVQEFKAKKVEIKQEQKKEKAAKKAKKKKAAEKAAAQGQAAGEESKAEETTAETGDEKPVEEQKKKPTKPKKKTKKGNAKQAEGGQDPAATESAATDSVVEDSKNVAAQEAQTTEKKASKKRVWKKRSKKEVGPEPAENTPVQATESGKNEEQKKD